MTTPTAFLSGNWMGRSSHGKSAQALHSFTNATPGPMTERYKCYYTSYNYNFGVGAGLNTTFT
jgi:hypothetical protein